MARPVAKVQFGDFAAVLSELKIKKLAISKAAGVSRGTVYQLVATGEATPEICLKLIDHILSNNGLEGLEVLKKYTAKSYIEKYILDGSLINESKIATLQEKVKIIESYVSEINLRSINEDQSQAIRIISNRLDRTSRILESKARY